MGETIGKLTGWLKPRDQGLAAAQRDIPKINYALVPDDGHDIFHQKFGHLSGEEWGDCLIRSIHEPMIDGVQFPGFPEETLQQRVHGHSGEASIAEAIAFHDFIAQVAFASVANRNDFKILDFGCGWGRMARPFLRDFPLTNIFGFEPNFLFCALARTLNPYMTFFSGSYAPDDKLPASFFNLVFGWSIFSHLSEQSLKSWFSEMERIVKPGGYCVFTTWGRRFLERLMTEAADRKAGKDIHWYSALCIEAAGSLEDRIKTYDSGQFVWWDSINNASYGEAFISKLFLQKTIDENALKFTIVQFDDNQLPQDAFVLKRV